MTHPSPSASLPVVWVIDPPKDKHGKSLLPEGVQLPRLARKVLPGGALGDWHRAVRIPLYLKTDFCAAWEANKSQWINRGFSVRFEDGAWWLDQWLGGVMGRYTLTRTMAARLTAAQAQRTARQPVIVTPPADLDLESLPELPFGLEAKLRPFQRIPSRQLFRALNEGKKEWGYPGAWDCSDMGVGKTYQCLAAALATGKRVGIICPKAVIGTSPRDGQPGSGWAGAFAHFGARPAFVENYEALRFGNRPPVSIEVVGKDDKGRDKIRFVWNCDPQDTALIFDEAHRMKNGSLNRKLGQAALRQGFHMICASGTMATTPLNLGATGVCVGLHGGDLAGAEKFLRAHGCRKFGSKWTFVDGETGRQHLANIHRTVFPRRGCRVRIKDLGDAFPENMIEALIWQTNETAKLAAAWERAIAVLRMKRAAGTPENVLRGAGSTVFTAAWEASEHAKVPLVIDRVEQEIEEGNSVAIFVTFTATRIALMEHFKTTCGIFGGQNQRDRDDAIAAFQADRRRVIVCQIKAGSTGVSLHDLHGNHPRVSIILPSNSPDDMTQAFGRIHRNGGLTKCRQYVPYAAGTMEEEICARVRGKIGNMGALNDGDTDPAAVF